MASSASPRRMWSISSSLNPAISIGASSRMSSSNSSFSASRSHSPFSPSRFTAIRSSLCSTSVRWSIRTQGTRSRPSASAASTRSHPSSTMSPCPIRTGTQNPSAEIELAISRACAAALFRVSRAGGRSRAIGVSVIARSGDMSFRRVVRKLCASLWVTRASRRARLLALSLDFKLFGA